MAERVKRMEAANVITGYHAQVNPAAIGYGITAFIRVAMRGHDLPIDTIAVQLPEIIECHAVTGDDCHIVKVLAPTVDRTGADHRQPDTLRRDFDLDSPVVVSQAQGDQVRRLMPASEQKKKNLQPEQFYKNII